MQTVTRADLIDRVYEDLGLSRNESATLVEQVLDDVIEALAKGETVKISGFASFNVRQKGKRVGRNPKTLEEKVIEPRRVISFRASHILKKAVLDGIKKKAKR
jgi:integration host factor subunit alpha